MSLPIMFPCVKRALCEGSVWRVLGMWDLTGDLSLISAHVYTFITHVLMFNLPQSFFKDGHP